jgi:hypothetical protein
MREAIIGKPTTEKVNISVDLTVEEIIKRIITALS